MYRFESVKFALDFHALPIRTIHRTPYHRYPHITIPVKYLTTWRCREPVAALWIKRYADTIRPIEVAVTEEALRKNGHSLSFCFKFYRPADASLDKCWAFPSLGEIRILNRLVTCQYSVKYGLWKTLHRPTTRPTNPRNDLIDHDSRTNRFARLPAMQKEGNDGLNFALNVIPCIHNPPI